MDAVTARTVDDAALEALLRDHDEALEYLRRLATHLASSARDIAAPGEPRLPVRLAGLADDGPGGPGDAPGGDAELDSLDARVLALLTAGCKDDAIARRLGLSARTVRRRVRRLMDRLGADTRFQAGLHAARRGWV